jgi:hypothetical protein
MKLVMVLVSCLFMANCSPNSPAHYAQTQEFQLSPPSYTLDSFFFKASAHLNFHPTVEGAWIQLIDVKDNPSKTYQNPLSITESSRLFAVARHDDYRDSDTISIQAIKVNDLLNDAEIVLSKKWSDKYKGRGNLSLVDKIKGSSNFHDGNWLGFQVPELIVNIQLQNQIEVHTIRLSILEDQSSWIFKPGSVSILTDDQRIMENHYDDAAIEKKGGFVILDFQLPGPLSLNELEVRIQSLNAIPEWHAGKGQLPWFFIDEILIN